MNNAVQKYLSGYAEPEAKNLDKFLDKILDSTPENPAPSIPTYQYCLVIPAFQESYQDLINAWGQLPENTLIILVLNSHLNEDISTITLFEEFQSRSTTQHLAANLHLLTRDTDKDVLLVDRCHSENLVPKAQGVGLARKIGADIALALIAKGIIVEPRISLTDADVRLPEDYFTPTMAPDEAALVYPFVHRASDELADAIQRYEIAMLYYVAGLKWSGSHYGFTTIGSLITVNPEHYAKVRGFPKRDAAEDFYLLNKLAKTGTIRSIQTPVIEIEARRSTRVPFGTGPALTRIIEGGIEQYRFYHPMAYQELRTFLDSFSALWSASNVRDLYRSSPFIDRYCEESEFYSAIESRKAKIKSKRVFDKFLIDWFDGFRTLKFIHQMREHYPSVAIENITDAPFIAEHHSLTELREQLAKLCMD